MHLQHLFRPGHQVFSIELFPPKTPEGVENLKAKLPEIGALHPEYISVTYGALGGTRHNTLEICGHVKRETHAEVMAHLTCVAHTREEIHSVLADLKAEGVDNIMALRGDPPKGETTFQPPEGGFRYASELVQAIRAEGSFGIGVAGYPEKHVESSEYKTDLQHQADKAKAGAEVVISQFFLVNDHFLRWRDDMRNAGVAIPIEAGILPAVSADAITNMAGVCGVEVPRSLLEGLEKYQDDKQAAADFGLEFAVKQVEALLKEGVDGIHLYALNKLAPIQAIAPLLK